MDARRAVLPVRSLITVVEYWTIERHRRAHCSIRGQWRQQPDSRGGDGRGRLPCRHAGL